jgi:hypothetical protein
MKTFPTIEQLVEVAVAGGHNEIDATEAISKSYDYIKRTYPNSSKKQLVHICYVTY